MIELSALYAILLPFIPTLGAIIGIICAVVRTVKNNKDTLTAISQPIVEAFDNLREEAKDKQKANECIQEVKELIEENRLLREQLAELQTEITKIKHEVK